MLSCNNVIYISLEKIINHVGRFVLKRPPNSIKKPPQGHCNEDGTLSVYKHNQIRYNECQVAENFLN